MLQLLIEQKETLALGEIISVGDLFDSVAEGDEAVSDDVRKNNVFQVKRVIAGIGPLIHKFHPLLSIMALKQFPT